MQPFVVHTGTFVCLDRSNVDTDAIVPARFLKRIDRVGFGELLFYDLRRTDGQPDPGFPLNQPSAAGASVLVARSNFGCGSSREHAVWAIAQAGFRAVLAPRAGTTPGFADIFRNNCYKNGVLPVEVGVDLADRLFGERTGRVTVDLRDCRVTAHLREGERSEEFAIAEGPRRMLLVGLDEIAQTLQYEEAIAAYEGNARTHSGSTVP